ncbi:LIM domain-containing protein [Pseudomonas fluorescens]|jgi:transposase-like protein|uniref:LIM domain-containing protein n=1 Tax=Pseudomonas fluorescens TaxID=294 RepID=UPI0034A06746
MEPISKCPNCEKTVYPMEKIRFGGHVFHKQCFKCRVCGSTLNLTNAKAFDGEVYCERHCPVPRSDSGTA